MDEQELDLDNLDNLLEDLTALPWKAASIRKATTAAKVARAKSKPGRLNIRKQTIYTTKNTKETTSWHTAIK